MRLLLQLSLCFLFLVPISLAKESCEQLPGVGTFQSATVLGGYATGTAFLVDETHIVTAAHCIASNEISVIFMGLKYKATIKCVDLHRDWAILVLDRKCPLAPVKLSDRVPAEDDTLMAYGYGSGWGVTKLKYRGNGRIEGKLTPGDSGGPMCNSAGEALSVNSWNLNETNECDGNCLGELKQWVEKWIKTNETFRVER